MRPLIEHYEQVISNITNQKTGVRHGTIVSGFYSSHSAADRKERISDIREEIDRLKMSDH